MEYIEYCGTYPDVPVQKIVQAWEKYYGKERVELWKKFWLKSSSVDMNNSPSDL